MPKKVLLATRPLTPPWDEASKNFAYFLSRNVRGHDIAVLGTKELLPGIPSSVTVVPIYPSGHFGLWEKMLLLSYLSSVRTDFDITHYLFTPTLTNSRLIEWFAKPRRGRTAQTIATLREDLYDSKEIKKLLFADRIIVYTNATRDKLLALGRDNVTRIYPGIDLEKFSPQPKYHALLASFGLDESHFIVMFPGEYTRLGATDMLTETFIRYFQAHPETPLRYLDACRVKNTADAKKKAWMKQKFEAAGVAHFVRFSETVADMPSLYNLADVVIFPVGDLNGKFDVPLVIIEAYACGKPVIVSDLPAFREFTGPDFSIMIPKASGEALLDSLTTLMAESDHRTRLGNAARAFVEANFDVRTTAQAYGDLYSSL